MTRRDLLRIMPVNGDDVEAARQVVALGFTAVSPVLRDMVNWLRVAESPVADTFAAFLGTLGEPAVGVVAAGLQRDNCWLRRRVFTQVLPLWPADAIRQLTDVLTLVATQPDAYDNDLLCVELLAEHRLVDLDWLRRWLAFKRERWTARHDLLKRAERRLRRAR